MLTDKAKRDELALEYARDCGLTTWPMTDQAAVNITAYTIGFDAGYKCRDDELAIPAGLEQERERSQKLVEALEDAVDTLASASENMQHYLDNSCIPTKEECDEVWNARAAARKALEEYWAWQ